MHLSPEPAPGQYHRDPSGSTTQSSSLSSDSTYSTSSDPGRVATDFDAAPTASMDYTWTVGDPLGSQSARSPYGAYQQAYIPSPLRTVLTGNTARGLNNEYPPMSAERHPPSPSTHATTITPEAPPPMNLASPRSPSSLDEDDDDSDSIPPITVDQRPHAMAVGIPVPAQNQPPPPAPRVSNSLISLVQDNGVGHLHEIPRENLPPIAPERIQKLVEAIELAATCVRGLTEVPYLSFFM